VKSQIDLKNSFPMLGKHDLSGGGWVQLWRKKATSIKKSSGGKWVIHTGTARSSKQETGARYAARKMLQKRDQAKQKEGPQRGLTGTERYSQHTKGKRKRRYSLRGVNKRGGGAEGSAQLVKEQVGD